MPEANYKTLTSEFLGTFLLVFTVGCNTVIGASGQWAALSIASVLMVSIYALGSVSGAMFNPAVALAVHLDGKFPDFTVGAMVMYMVFQFLGGVVAALLSLWVHGNAMNLQPGAGYSYGGAAVIEIFYTFMLCFVVLKAAVYAPEGNEFFGLAIGFVIVAGGYGGGFISCGAFNPAVALGIDVGSAGQGVYWSLIYFAYEFAGAALAVALHKALLVTGEKPTLGQKCLSEALGTFTLVFTVGCNVLGGSSAPALSIAASLMCMIYALGGVSGAHFNPAVTLALTMVGEVETGEIAAYMGSQIVGGIAAGVAYTNLIGESVPLAPGAGYGWTACGIAELVYTFVLCFVVLNVVGAVPGTKAMSDGGASKHIYGLAIGFCIVAGGYAIGAVSGGSLNPAVSIGLDVSDLLKGGSVGNSLMYSVFEFAGAAVAALTFKTVRPGAKAGQLGERKPLMP